jgi:RNA recognition motif-containing protein
MVKSIYVGNLPWKIHEDELKAAFEQHAPVISARIITEKGTGRSKGFGFVEVDDENLEKIVQAMNGADFNGRPLVVNEARPREAKA